MLPIACELSDEEQAARRQELAGTLFSRVLEVQELDDGVAVCFPAEAGWPTRLLEFIEFERRCCPFFTYELVFEPARGPVWLRLRGEEGAKQLAAEWFGRRPRLD